MCNCTINGGGITQGLTQGQLKGYSGPNVSGMLVGNFPPKKKTKNKEDV